MFHKEKAEIKEKKAKRLRQLCEEETKLWASMRNRYMDNLIPLDKPIFYGYKKFFVVREDYARRRDAMIYRRLCKCIQSVITSRDTDFMYKDWKTGKMKPMEHKPRYYREVEFGKVPLDLQKYFRKVIRTETIWFGKQVINYPIYELEKDFMFVPAMDKHYITHKRKIYPEIESRIEEIRKEIWDGGKNEAILRKMKGWGNGYEKGYDDIKRKIEEDWLNKMAEAEVQGYVEI